MEPIQVSNPLLELLPKELLDHEDNNVFRRPNVLPDPSSFEGPSSRTDERQLELLVIQLHGDDDLDLQLRALQALDVLVASPDDFEIKAEVVHYTGALTGLLVLLANDNNPSFQVHSAKIIKHLAASDLETKATIVNHPGALDGLAQSFSKTTNPSLQQNAAWALRHLAASNDDTKSKIVQEFVLKALVTVLEDGNDPTLHSTALSTWRNLEAGGSETKFRMVSQVLEHDVKALRRQCLLQEIDVEGDLFKGLGTHLLNLENDEEVRTKSEETNGNSSRSMEDGNHMDEDKHTRGTNDGKQTENCKQMDDHKQTGGAKKGKERDNGKQTENCKQMDDQKQTGGVKEGKKRNNGKQRDDGKKTGDFEKGKKRDDVKHTTGLGQFNGRDDGKEIGGLEYNKEWDAGKKIGSGEYGKDWDAGKEIGGWENVEEWDAGKEIRGWEYGKEWDAGKQRGDEEDGKQKDGYLGCCSFFSLFFGPRLGGWWSNDVDVSSGERPLEMVLMSLSNDLIGKDDRLQRKVLLDLCNRTRAPLNGKSASYIARHLEGLRELVTLLSTESLRGLAGLVLKNLATNHRQIMVTIVELLISLTTFANTLQESAVWGLGSLAASNDNIKDEISILEHRALNSLVARLLADINYPKANTYLERLKAAQRRPRHGEWSPDRVEFHSEQLVKLESYSLQTMAAMTLRNLATGDFIVKARICQFPDAVDRLVSSLTAGLDDLPMDCNDSSDVELPERDIPNEQCLANGYGEVLWKDEPRDVDPRLTAYVIPPDLEFVKSVILHPVLSQNAALAIGYLAGGDEKTKATLIEHPRTLIGLALALTRAEDPILKQNAAFALGNLASGDGPAKAKILDHPGVLNGLVLALMKDECPILQQNAAFALGNLADGDDRAKAEIVDLRGAVEALVVSLTKKANPALQKSAARALDLLAIGDSKTRSKIANHPGALEGLVFAALNLDNLGMRHHLKWASRSLATNDDVETMARTKICDDLWKLYSQPGVFAVSSISPLPERSDINDPFKKFSDGEIERCDGPKVPVQKLSDGEIESRIGTSYDGPKDWKNYVQFGYRSLRSLNCSYLYWTQRATPGRQTRIAKSLHDQPHLETLLLEAVPNNMAALQNSPILQRQAIRNLCNAVASPDRDPSPLICGKIVDYPGVLDGLGIVLIEDSNPHLQRMAVRTLKVLAAKGDSETAQKLVDHPAALLTRLVTCFTTDKDPALQENALETLHSLVKVLSEGKNSNHAAELIVLVKALTIETHPSWQLKLYGILRSLSRNKMTALKIVEHLTLLLEPGNIMSFQYLASSLVLHLAWTGHAATVAKIVDLHPWVLESLVVSLQPSCESDRHQYLCFYESPDKRDDPKVLPALVLDHLLTRGDNATKAKLANYRGLIAVLLTALAEERSRDRSSEVQEKAACSLSHLAGGDDETKVKLVEHPGALGGLLKQLCNDNRMLRRTSALALANLALGTVQTRAKLVDHPGVLAGLVMSLTIDESPVLQAHGAQALLLLAAGDVETSTKVIRQPGALEWLVKSLANDENPRLQYNSVFALRNLALAEVHREGLRETDGLVEGLQVFLEKEGPSLEKRQIGLRLVEKETPSPLRWAMAACTLTLLDPARGNGTHLHCADAYCGRGRANMLLGLLNEALDDFNMADRLQQLREPDGDLNLDLSRAVWRYRSSVKKKLGDVQGALDDKAKLQQSS